MPNVQGPIVKGSIPLFLVRNLYCVWVMMLAIWDRLRGSVSAPIKYKSVLEVLKYVNGPFRLSTAEQTRIVYILRPVYATERDNFGREFVEGFP